MTQEEKQLLLKDLCARLPYGVIVHIKLNHNIHGLEYNSLLHGFMLNENVGISQLDGYTKFINLNEDEVKPYLRPMSSVTEEEIEKLKEYSGLKYDQLDLASFQNRIYKCLDFYLSEVPSEVVILVFDWLNAHHFDYRGLIEEDLAIEVPEGMYKTQ